MQAEFDVIVVGAGPAGSAAALALTRKGVSVLMLEKAKIPGERNMTGGVLYGDFPGEYGFISLVPDFESSAPLERHMLSHEVVLLGPTDYQRGESRYFKLSKASLAARLGLFNLSFGTGHDYTVLRRDFDRWFANSAVQAGAMLSTESTVEGLIKEGGSVVGVRTTKEELRAKLVIDSSGVTSKLVEEAGLRGRLLPEQLYHGIKRVYKLDASTIEKRFKVAPGEGRSIFFLGEFMQGVGGGAFVYTNRDTLSVGLVVSMESLLRETTEHFDRVGKLIDIQDGFEAQPMVAELLDGAEPLEYAAHNIPKGFKSILKTPYMDGFLVTGDALGSFVKIGSMIDGMRRAIASGIMAARAFLEVSPSDSFRSANLSRYRAFLAPIYEDVSRSSRDSFISESSFAYHALPRLVFGIRLISSSYAFEPRPEKKISGDATQRVQSGTSLLNYDEDKNYAHIKVDQDAASKSLSKPWIPACPTNCYTLVTPKGIFSSFKDLFDHNLAALVAADGGAKATRVTAFSLTKQDMAAGRLKFDYVACVSCGTCGAIGPPEMVSFGHERSGHGVRYAYG
ncbi:MAG: FAD-dependent oxidoreductase [Nitrososphaerales archaeon]|jgi:electron transfer flavoprotein-quinone oxidoreductase